MLDGISSIEDRRSQYRPDFLDRDLRKEASHSNDQSSVINRRDELNNSNIMNPPKLTYERRAWLYSLSKGDIVRVWGDHDRSTKIIRAVSNGFFHVEGGSIFRTSDGYHAQFNNTWIEPPSTLRTIEATEMTESDSKEELTGANQYLSKTSSIKAKRNPWTSGSFFLVALVVIAIAFAIISAYVPWYVLPIVLIGTILAVGIVGALQLRNDEGLAETNFMSLMLETYKRLPLLKQDKRNPPEK